jgi:hypothetical protein
MNEQSATEANTYDKVAIQTAIDAAIVASQNAKQARKSYCEALQKFTVARAIETGELIELGLCEDKAFDDEAFNKFIVARASAAEEVKELKRCEEKAFHVYSQAHANALEAASVSNALIAEMEAHIKIECARLGVEMDPLSGKPRF